MSPTADSASTLGAKVLTLAIHSAFTVAHLYLLHQTQAGQGISSIQIVALHYASLLGILGGPAWMRSGARWRGRLGDIRVEDRVRGCHIVCGHAPAVQSAGR